MATWVKTRLETIIVSMVTVATPMTQWLFIFFMVTMAILVAMIITATFSVFVVNICDLHGRHGNINNEVVTIYNKWLPLLL